MKPRVVLDTSVIVSGLLGGTATEVIRRWRAGDFTLVISPSIIAEYEAVLARPKFRLPRWVVEDLLEFIRKKAEWVTPDQTNVEVSRDPSDSVFLQVAVSGQAGWLVSGDNDLLDLGEFRGVRIVPPQDFLRLL